MTGPPNTVLLEREAPLQAVDRLVGGVVDGAGGCLFIVGEAGLGKTSVLAAGQRMAAGRVSVGTASGDAMETWFPFGLVARALHELGGPDLLERPGDQASGSAARAAQFLTVLRWLQSSAGEPKLLVLDDLHWADADSLSLVAFVCRRLGGLRAGILGSLRPWPAGAIEVASALAGAGHAAIERLEPLSPPAAGGLMSARLGRPVPAPVLDRAYRLSAGNPLLLEQLVRPIERGEDIPAPADDGPPPAQSVLLARFAGLPAGGLRIAQAASVLGGGFDFRVAAEIAQLDGGDAAEALEALYQSGLVQSVTAASMEFVHPLFAQALYESMAPPVRALLHRRAFSILVGRGLETEAAEHAVRAGLLGDAEAIAVLERTGRAALRTGALATAVQRLEAAARLATSRASPDLLLALGEAQLAQGRAADLVVGFGRILDGDELSPASRVQALRILGRALYATGDYAAGSARLELAARLAEAQDPRAAAGTLVDLALATWLLDGPARSLELLGRASGLAAGVDPSLQLIVEGLRAAVALEAGDASGLDAIIAAAGEFEGAAPARMAELCWTWGGAVLISCGKAASIVERFSLAERIAAAASAAAERVGAAPAIVALSFCHAETLVRRGRLEEAVELATRNAGQLELVPAMAPSAGVGLANILLHLGRLDESDAWCSRVEAAASGRGEWLALLWAWHLRGQRSLRDGSAAGACAVYERIEETVERAGIGEPCVVPWARYAIAAYLARGRLQDARRVLEWLERCSSRLPCRWPRIAAATSRALLADQSGDREGAGAYFERALALHGDVDLPLEEVETRLAYGAFLRRSGWPARARPVLADALALATRTGAAWLAGHVRAELTLAGGRGRRRRPPDQLTPSEERVARLVATGQSNADVAGQLSVSVNTVETHLRHLYAKLGVRSRLELAAWVARTRPWPPGPSSE